jgi:hypothetical protein
MRAALSLAILTSIVATGCAGSGYGGGPGSSDPNGGNYPGLLSALVVRPPRDASPLAMGIDAS